MANKSQKKIVDLPKDLRSEITLGIINEGKVKVIGLGIFETKKIPSRSGRHPSTGKIVSFRAYTKIKFRPTKSLKELL